MREDMFKVIVERPRSGRSRATKSKIRYDKCAGRSRVSGHRLVMEATGNVKHLNENLAPLKRYLCKQVGRRWDDVFSEICQHLDTGSTVKMHVREHLDDFVERNVRRDSEGVLWSHNGWRGPQKLMEMRTELYVDPDDGLIKETRKLCQKLGVPFAPCYWALKRSEVEKKQKPIHKICKFTWHVQLGGIWYSVKLSNVPKCKAGYVLNNNELYVAIEHRTWRDHDRWSLLQKSQLSHKALKTHNLTNQHSSKEEYYG